MPSPRPIASRWVAFLGDRVAHGYRWDKEEKAWVSLCKTRTEDNGGQNARGSTIRGTKAEVPVADDPYGACQRCWARSFPGTRTTKGHLRASVRRSRALA